MIGRLGKILTILNIGLQTARSILGKNMTLNTKITEGQFRILENYAHNLSLKHKADAKKPVPTPTDYLNGVPEEIYANSTRKDKRDKAKKKRRHTIPTASTSKKGSAKYSDSYSLKLLKSNLVKKFEGYVYGLSDW